jgi:hypothetical protein
MPPRLLQQAGEAGRSDEAARLRRYGTERGDRTANPSEANIQG